MIPLTLDDISAATLAVSLLMYLLLDGTDLGVGMLLFFFRDDESRRKLAVSILPVWDANETWLVLLAGGMLTLFPAVYSTLFSAVYLPLFIMLLALIGRAVALEYRGHVNPRWHRCLDLTHVISSLIATFIQGALVGLVIAGRTQEGPFSWLTLYPALCGFGLIAAYLLCGCCWVQWRIAGSEPALAHQLAWLFLILSLALMIAINLLDSSTLLQAWQRLPGKIILLLMALTLAALLLAFYRELPLLSLILVLTLIALSWALLIVGLYPWLLPGKLTIQQAAAAPATQLFLLSGYGIILPLTLAYNSWAFWVFRARVR
ncbi:cytochrome bd-type quinol oxidase, subunit 2 [Mixta theicola]|uniref:Cytochrome bd-type quinol oxidase, subunit 2 n=1 Tax=Mixta theicola TaxID=1458355 RepID=A0A2K1QDT5_9GAMM|nr:cytochrome d ubiquinol oxidase subunit II [Mixta theicola]PNS13199.1 cytochrome bd-type quinol oxidase, subunit 2 [Mixta theicola]GLR09479.1 cytochrome D oxidase subunit II [Mixta theicola]